MWDEMGHEPYSTWVLLERARLVASAADGAERALDLNATALRKAIEHDLAPFALDAVVGVAKLMGAGPTSSQVCALQGVVASPAATSSVRERAATLLTRLHVEVDTTGPPPGCDRRDRAGACLSRVAGA